MPQPTNNELYDAIVIGAGMSGLGAGIRLAYAEQRVLLLERHNAAGGLNGFYSFAGRKYDVGLHALTNYVRPEIKGTPLGKLLRQTRIRREELDLCEQLGSRIAFPQLSLRFTNDREVLKSEVQKYFPAAFAGFEALIQAVEGFAPYALEARPYQSTRQALQTWLREPLLVEMLLCPLLFYGSAHENDMDFDQFVILFRSIYLEGFARPFEGVRVILRLLLERYRQLGGKKRMKCSVRAIEARGPDKPLAVHLESGETLLAKKVFSSIGWPETLQLCGQAQAQTVGRLSFVETITILDVQPQSLGWQDTIVFFNASDQLRYERPQGLVDPRSGVLCIPNNYQYGDRQLPEGILRMTALANYDAWAALSPQDYLAAKAHWYTQLQARALQVLPPLSQDLQAHSVAHDMFTPTTIHKYTSHLSGAVYGSPHKAKNALGPLPNLFICGSDQGLLGIVGALLSGVSVANAVVSKG